MPTGSGRVLRALTRVVLPGALVFLGFLPATVYASAKSPHVSVWMSSSRPVQSSVVTSTLRFTTGTGRAIRNAKVKLVWRSRTFYKSASLRTNADGVARWSCGIGNGLTGAKIMVTATARLGRKSYSSSSGFVPQPHPWVLTTPESAVRSYLDWTSFAYRIRKAAVARPTMSADELARVQAYITYLSNKGRIIDMTLTSIAVGVPSVDGSDTLVPAHEHWAYRYASLKTRRTVAGPYAATYDTTYTVTQPGTDWIVDSVRATPPGDVK
jgi:hypothetical protein